jgi:hypothetical protein
LECAHNIPRYSVIGCYKEGNGSELQDLPREADGESQADEADDIATEDEKLFHPAQNKQTVLVPFCRLVVA